MKIYKTARKTPKSRRVVKEVKVFSGRPKRQRKPRTKLLTTHAKPFAGHTRYALLAGKPKKHRRRIAKFLGGDSKLSVKNIVSDLKLYAIGTVGVLVGNGLVNKAGAMFSARPEYPAAIKLGTAIILPRFVKHPAVKTACIGLGIIAVYDYLRAKMPKQLASIGLAGEEELALLDAMASQNVHGDVFAVNGDVYPVNGDMYE